MALGRKWFGKIQVALFGKDGWDAQDATKVWDDGGSIRQAIDAATANLHKELQAIVSENAVLAVSDFASTGSAALRAEDGGEVIVGVRLESGQAHQILEIPLRALFTASLMDARKRLGTDTEAQDVVSSLLTICQQIVQALQPPRQAPAGLAGLAGQNYAQAAMQQQLSEKALARRPAGRVVNPIAPAKMQDGPVFPGPAGG